MFPFRPTPDDYWDDTFADFKMAREFSKLHPKEHSDEGLPRKMSRLGDRLEDPIPQSGYTVYSDHSDYVEEDLHDQDGPDISIKLEELNQPHQIDSAYWREKAHVFKVQVLISPI
jgi:hypothetical protein